MPGRRIRVTGQVGRAYDAPRIKATAMTDLGPVAIPAPRSLSGGPSVAVEWQLVRVAGTVLDVHKLGDRWRAELRVGSAKVVDPGSVRSRDPLDHPRRGSTSDVVGIARRPYPGNGRSAVSRSSRARPSDLAVGPVPGRVGRVDARIFDGRRTPRRTAAPSGRSTSRSAPEVGLDELADHAGERIKVGGLVVDLVADGFTLDDGRATGRDRPPR